MEEQFEAMKEYEKTIRLKAFWLTFIRRWKVILIILVPTAIITLFISQVFVPKQYQSTAVFLNNSNMTATQHSSAQLQIQKDVTLDKASKDLEDNYSITLTSSQILNGLSFAAFASNNPGVVQFFYTTNNKNHAKPVVEAVSKAALEELSLNGFDKMVISSSANNPVSVGKGKTYLLIGLAASIILGIGIAFVDEIVSDEVYDEDDITLLGSSSYGLIVTKK